ncbi:MAG: DUF6495 family protein [Saprospiraceae bacterium]|jgi:hypothetical protein|nr:DUF6495 family protein [Saprospiraceae bacterium]MDG1435989.1 DUF6495 family protein [Saprospiraceae bacterium]MDG2419471.1 DUF6495 family protein [Saprospiraceae bacterium]
MDFRRLTNNELEELKTEFVRFLVSNTVTGDDWEKIKKENPERAEGLIEIFSDIVFKKIISKVEYLEMKTPKDLKIFKCNKEDIELMGLKVEGDSDLDFTKDIVPEEMIIKLQSSDAKLQMYSANKKYKDENRLQEIFQMMQWGSLISDGKLFRLLRTLKK